MTRAQHNALGTPSATSESPRKPNALSRPLGAAIVMLAILAVMFGLEVFDQASPVDLDTYGIEAQELDGLPGIFSAPFLHAGYAHLWSNAVPLFVLGWLTLIGGLAQFLVAALGIIVASGLFAWAFTFGDGTQYVIGASGLVFGLLTYLLARGIFTRNGKQILISVVVFVLYGTVLFGVLPTDSGVSWQAHLGGAIGGVVMAWVLSRRQRAGRASTSAKGAAPTL
ncbi:rhomboid family intramembrane serine protease [Epidermidibacterium keratini]|uniref:Rhomboid family intramembrane serine protease n=1 Tax=Epidermidibacterium keratini TaxID=1891644 RepID=A0A7L4YJV0_9ACTN|nr:rhomboid family intramembrane serine protease [Epidermidibacterium keratini]QHB99505.1 rhomboid family intramembrane serine protease [Epidermidibacterium keratini]